MEENKEHGNERFLTIPEGNDSQPQNKPTLYYSVNERPPWFCSLFLGF